MASEEKAGLAALLALAVLLGGLLAWLGTVRRATGDEDAVNELRASVAAHMSEETLQACVLDLAGILGYKRVHFRPAPDRHGRWKTHQQGDDGFPDCVIAGHGRVIVAELKRETGGITPDQAAWLAEFTAGEVETFVWRPADWVSGAIEAELRRSRSR